MTNFDDKKFSAELLKEQWEYVYFLQMIKYHVGKVEKDVSRSAR